MENKTFDLDDYILERKEKDADFAKDFDTIKAILADGFKVFYCLEEVYSTRKGIQHIGIPMASFCDSLSTLSTGGRSGQVGFFMPCGLSG